MYRNFTKTLEEWDANGAKKPLMVIGARQTGKTWVIRDFLNRKFPDHIYLNLEERGDLRSVFDGTLDPDSILRGLEQMLSRKISPDTPIFIDEIQASENAVTSLKYFCEDPRNFKILSAGSLLGVKIHRFHASFPVGKVEIEYLYPMDFEEFLLACDEAPLRDGIRSSFSDRKPLPEGVHNKALKLYHDYLFTGGMPEVILDYLAHEKDVFAMDKKILSNLQLAYMADMTNYVTSPQESVKILDTWRSVPRQLAKDNPKFKYSEVRKGMGRRDFRGPLDWLAASEMIYKVDNVVRPDAPLQGYDDPNSFKIYLSDVGILSNLCGVRYKDLLPDTHNIYKGGIVENYVYQQMRIRYPELYYFKPNESLEIDLLLDDGNDIIPTEIKSGRHRRSTSLKNYRAKYHPPYAIRISEMNFGMADGLLSVPLYAVFCI
ncbi:MAG: ATP-binding protein [Anaerovoracaceae bacterium]